MPTNRLLPWQFAVGSTLDGTRIEQALMRLAELYDDVPADLVQRRWSPSSMVWGFSPPDPATPSSLPWMGGLNKAGLKNNTLQNIGAVRNVQRVKSCAVPTIHLDRTDEDLFTMEVSFKPSRPVVIGQLTVMAQFQSGGQYQNRWKYGAIPPPGKVQGDGTTDFTLQCCIDDGWSLDDRKKLRQESLLWQTSSDAFLFTRTAPPAQWVNPPNPIGAWIGLAVISAPLILVPAMGRVRFQWTIPLYDAPADTSSWGEFPWIGNVWSMTAECWEATR